MDTEDSKKVLFYFKNPTKKGNNGSITIEAKNFEYKYPLIEQLHEQVLNIVRDPNTGEGINGFLKSRAVRSQIERYTKTGLTQEEIDGFRKYIYSRPAASTFINSGKQDMVNDLIEELSNEMGSMTTYGGKRTKRRRGKKSRKGKSKKRYSRRR